MSENCGLALRKTLLICDGKWYRMSDVAEDWENDMTIE